jgi:hypothetical protein
LTGAAAEVGVARGAGAASMLVVAADGVAAVREDSGPSPKVIVSDAFADGELAADSPGSLARAAPAAAGEICAEIG